MAPTSFNDFGSKSNELFNENHDSGLFKASKSGKFGTDGVFNIEFERDIDGGDMSNRINFEADGCNVSFDKEYCNIEFGANVKQVEGLSLNFNPSFHAHHGFGLGDLAINFQNKKSNVNLKSSISASPLINFDAAMGCSKGAIGIKGEFDAKTSALNGLGWGVHKTCGDIEVAFVNENYLSPFQGTMSVYKTFASGPFCCYGVQADTASGKLAVAWGSKCCSSLTKFKLDQDGVLSVAKSSKLNGALSLNVASALNLKDLPSGGHKFGVGLSFN